MRTDGPSLVSHRGRAMTCPRIDTGPPRRWAPTWSASGSSYAACVRGETGPTGGPAMTDVLGVCESWDDGRGRRTTREGRPGRDRHRRHRLGQAGAAPPVACTAASTPSTADRLALPGWQPVESEPLGEWVLRASGGFSSRGNSVLALGDPGMPLAGGGRRGCSRVVRGPVAPPAGPRAPRRARRRRRSPPPAGRPYEPTLLMLGLGVPGAAPARPRVRRRGAARRHGRRGLAGQRRAGGALRRARPGGCSRPARSPSRPCATRPATVLARGRGAFHGDWVGVSSLCDPGGRPWHRVWARAVLRSLLEWGAERGATTTYLQVVVANAAAQELYQALRLRGAPPLRLPGPRP